MATTAAAGRRATYTLNAAAFDCDPVTDAAAYFGGLLLTDGWVSDDGSAVELELAEGDRLVLDRLAGFLDCTHPVRTRVRRRGGREYRHARLRVNSPALAASLRRYGVVPRKSGVARVPDFLAGNRHAWRGVVDGNGWVYPPNRVGLCGTRAVCEQFREYVATLADSPAAVAKDGPGATLYRIDYRRSGAPQLIAAELYRDTGLAIPRKLAAAREVMSHGAG